MWNSLKSFFKSLKLKRILLGSTLSVLVILFLLKIIFPLLGQLTFSKTGFQVNNYYSVVAITLVCLIPYLNGLFYAHKLRDEKVFISSDLQSTPDSRNNILLIRVFFVTFLSFVFVLLSILLTNPVSTEGWLRNLFAACILATQTSFLCLLFVSATNIKMRRFYGFAICCLYLITVPFGLLVHHPWNYFAFFSPLYWVAWAWIIRSPVESLEYGIIAIIITMVMLIILTRNFLRKNTGR